MPVRSLNSPVLSWPSRAEVEAAACKWAEEASAVWPELVGIGCFGSCARATDWGVGSDVDLVAIVAAAAPRHEQRRPPIGLEQLPVPADLLIYTTDEWRQLQRQGTRFARVLADETLWLVGAAPRDDP